MSGPTLDYASWLKWREGRTIHPDFEALTQAAYRSGYRRALEDAADTATRELINIAGIRETVIDPDTLRARAAAADPRETRTDR